MENKLYKLEALRGLAAIYVVIHHTLPHQLYVGGINFGYLLRFGQEAVILFFLLSGFVIHYSFERSRDQSFGAYFARRFVRIYVPLIIVFLISYFVLSWSNGEWQDPQLRELLGNLLMLQDWGDVKPNVIVGAYLGNGPLWSLSYEWWFYMMFYPIYACASNPQRTDNLVFGVAVLAALVYVVYPTFLPRLLMYFSIWWAGVTISRQYIAGSLGSIKVYLKPVLALATIVVLLAVNLIWQWKSGAQITFGKHPVLELRHFVFALVALISAILWHKLHWRMFDLLIKPFMVFAPISYVIYICHWHLFARADYLEFVGNSYLQWALYFLIVIVVSYLIELKFYEAVKRPAIRRVESLVNRLLPDRMAYPKRYFRQR